MRRLLVRIMLSAGIRLGSMGAAMDTRYIEEYLAFARHLNYTRAAKEAFVSASTLTAHVADLEKEIGCALVDKWMGKLELTAAGRRLAELGPSLIASAAGIGESCREAARTVVEVRVVTSGLTRFEEFVMAAARRFPSVHEGRRLEVRTSEAFTQGKRALDEFGCDIAPYSAVRLGDGEPNTSDAGELPRKFLYTEPVYFYVSHENPLFQKDSLTVADLDGSRLSYSSEPEWVACSRAMQATLAAAGAHVELCHHDCTSLVQYMCSGGSDELRPVGRETRHKLGEGMQGGKALPVGGIELVWDVYAMYRPDGERAEAVKALIEAM